MGFFAGFNLGKMAYRPADCRKDSLWLSLMAKRRDLFLFRRKMANEAKKYNCMVREYNNLLKYSKRLARLGKVVAGVVHFIFACTILVYFFDMASGGKLDKNGIFSKVIVGLCGTVLLCIIWLYFCMMNGRESGQAATSDASSGHVRRCANVECIEWQRETVKRCMYYLKKDLAMYNAGVRQLNELIAEAKAGVGEWCLLFFC